MTCRVITVGEREYWHPDKPGFFYPFTTGCSPAWRASNYETPPLIGDLCPCEKWPKEVARQRGQMLEAS